jgi:hypothetical protein
VNSPVGCRTEGLTASSNWQQLANIGEVSCIAPWTATQVLLYAEGYDMRERRTPGPSGHHGTMFLKWSLSHQPKRNMALQDESKSSHKMTPIFFSDPWSAIQFLGTKPVQKSISYYIIYIYHMISILIYKYIIDIHLIPMSQCSKTIPNSSGDVDACYLHYLQALARLDDAWGDPRKPGGRGHPFAAFLVWKLGLISYCRWGWPGGTKLLVPPNSAGEGVR